MRDERKIETVRGRRKNQRGKEDNKEKKINNEGGEKRG